MKKILVPSDFSENAHQALHYAFSMAAKMGAETHVLSVLSMPPSTSGTTGSLFVRMKEQAQIQMHRLLEQLREEGHEIHPAIREGSMVNSINDMAEEIGADCIVMGTKGESNLDNVVMGSVATKVIASANIPVICVPAGCRYSGLKKIIYATDFMKSGPEVVEKLLKLSAAFDSRLDVLHIYKPNVEPPIVQLDLLRKELRGHLEERTIKFHIHKNDDIREGIVDFIDAAEPDMLAMVTKKRGLIGKIFDPSLTKKVAMSVEIPLISYRLE